MVFDWWVENMQESKMRDGRGGLVIPYIVFSSWKEVDFVVVMGIKGLAIRLRVCRFNASLHTFTTFTRYKRVS